MPQREQPDLVRATPLQRLRQGCLRWRYALGALALLAVFALSSIPNSHPPRIRHLDKAEHVVEYFLLALLFLNIATRGYARIGGLRLLGAWLAVLATTVLDESYQRWIPGRSFDLWDMAASGAGGVIAVGTVLLAHALQARPGPPPP
jgi:VanZ family protein